MADLLAHLVLPNSSQESFHSSTEHHSTGSPTDPSTKHDSVIPQPTSQSQFSAFQAAGLRIHDVDDYLAAPENAALIHRAPDRKSVPTTQLKPEMKPAQPVSLGSKSSHHLIALHSLCQGKGLVPEFHIDGDSSIADFGGFLKIGDVTIASDERWHSKKEAREALAETAFATVNGMEAKGKGSVTPGENHKNWVGMLVGKCLVCVKTEQEWHYFLTICLRVPPTSQSKPGASLQ